jgi:hypothetical protein
MRFTIIPSGFQSHVKMTGAPAANSCEAAVSRRTRRRPADEQAQHSGAVECESGGNLLQPKMVGCGQPQ